MDRPPRSARAHLPADSARPGPERCRPSGSTKRYRLPARARSVTSSCQPSPSGPWPLSRRPARSGPPGAAVPRGGNGPCRRPGKLGAEWHAVHPLHSVTAAPPVSSAETPAGGVAEIRQCRRLGTLRQRPTAAAKPGIAAMFSWWIARWWHARPPVVRVQRKQSTTGNRSASSKMSVSSRDLPIRHTCLCGHEVDVEIRSGAISAGARWDFDDRRSARIYRHRRC